ncbi:MAG: 3-dehydroquinate synthase [Acidobacteria bacterium]|nr:3-dehydroquinate synthase [Acidobacteriota bacterium]
MVVDVIMGGRTEMVIEAGLPDQILPNREGRARVAVLTQPGATNHATNVARSIRAEGYEVEIIGLPDRDEAKSLDVAASVYETLARFGLGRQDTIVGVGGGSVTDLSGFVAGTWLRGVEVVHVPTTLLAAVDASIGGKTGVNLAGKNLVGVFWHPTRVVVDTTILDDLPGSLLREGLAEALKVGLIGDTDLVELLEAHGAEAPIGEVVRRATAVKSRIVDDDEREQGKRAFLNFGHTIGHAVEFASTLSHGESVGLGMVAAARISQEKDGFSEAERVTAAISDLGIPVEVSGLDRARVKDLLRHDKKRDAKGLRMVLLESIGSPVLRHVDSDEIDIGLAAIKL